MIVKLVVEDTVEMELFNHISMTPQVFLYELSPEQAEYILNNFNNDNRKIAPSQTNNISSSVENSGWLFDGQSIAFNTNGDLTEGQHRLTHIAKCPEDKKFTISVATGVEPDSFSKCALPKARRALDEIYRKDNTVVFEESAILGDLLKRRRGGALTIHNAIEQWGLWKNDIKMSREITSSCFSNCDSFSSQAKTFGAWATLCIRYGHGELASIFLDLLENEYMGDSSTKLSKDFKDYWEQVSPYIGSQEGRLTVIFQMLCVITDRLNKNSDGRVDANFDASKLNHSTMKKCGFYQEMLVPNKVKVSK